MILLTGSANPNLAKKIATLLDIHLAKININQFSDGETRIEILEPLRAKDVYILQSTSNPTNHHLMELFLISDAAKRAGAKSITAVMPYFGYARQDKRLNAAQVPISAKMVADLLATVGVNRVLTVDLHAEQIQGFFSIPVENLYTSSVFLEDIKKQNYSDPLVVSPDVGGVVRARAFATLLDHADLAIIDKRRPKSNVSQVMNIIGNAKDRCCILIDDMVDTAGTICHAAKALKEQGAKKVVAYVTHPVLSGNALEIIAASPLDELIVTDTIPLTDTAKSVSKIRQLSVANIITVYLPLFFSS